MSDFVPMVRRNALGLGIATAMAVTGMGAGVDATSYGPLDFGIVVDPVVREDDCGQPYPTPGTCAPRPDPNP